MIADARYKCWQAAAVGRTQTHLGARFIDDEFFDDRFAVNFHAGTREQGLREAAADDGGEDNQ